MEEETKVKISELENAISINNEDIIPIVQNGDTKKITYENLNTPINNEIEELINAIYYNIGDTYSTGNNYAGGSGSYLSSSRTTIAFTIVTPKILNNINSVLVNALRIRVRSVEGTYLLTGGNSYYADLITNKDSQGNNLAQSCTSLTASIVSDNQIRVQAVFDGAVYTTNNTPVAVEYRNLELSFS